MLALLLLKVKQNRFKLCGGLQVKEDEAGADWKGRRYAL